jgi:EAL domain-containing protein (putative c-di-GMP-specific phosphodiesterase class I)/AmiR/NasT family two-component response regulator
MVVEDQTVQRRIAVQMLQSLGIGSIDEAADGGAALGRMSSQHTPPDVIICDLRMPGMDGIEFIRHLGEAGRRPALVLASALDAPLLGAAEAVARAQGIDVLGALAKPLTLAKLAEILGRYRPIEPLSDWEPEVDLERTELAEAIAGDGIHAHFQPRVRVADGHIQGAEALARWRHPSRGIISPGLFIPFAEQCGLIDALTWVMVERALTQAAEWKKRGEDWTVSVNLSLHYLESNTVADRLAALTEEYGVAPANVMLEVTESLAATKLAPVIANLARLRMRGFGVAVDDYGTGYASLEQLSRIPFNELKIDRSFVHGASDKAMLRAILGSSIELARRLNLSSVAEGAETDADFALLGELECDLVQGFYIARPMPAEEFLAWTERWRR